MAMKKTLLAILLLAAATTATLAQDMPTAEDNHFVYYQYEYGATKDTSSVTVVREGNSIQITYPSPKGNLIQGYGQSTTTVDYDGDSITQSVTYADGTQYYYRSQFSRHDISWVSANDQHCCAINSNSLCFEMEEIAGLNVTPLPQYGNTKGVMMRFTRNGQLRMELKEWKQDKKVAIESLKEDAIRVTPRELDQIMKNRMIMTTRVFDNAQICWGKENSRIEGEIPYDSVLHYAGGTLILKRIKMPKLPQHYQTFIELHQRSNGDAYDRTGSVFVIPEGYNGITFFEGMNSHPDSLPTIMGKDGEKYQGIVAKEWYNKRKKHEYRPVVELMRFFTPFGVGHFNERIALEGLTWENEAYYKQEITDLVHLLQQEEGVLIGVWIGNYDGGGHKVTLDIKQYPGSIVADEPKKKKAPEYIPLFNTCNVLEMAGQNYGKIFGTDSLSVSFTIPEGASNVELRYISTGHGGWKGGDEFNPKTNHILIDNKTGYTHTPWRQDCGCYRELNPVSGNFWNGLSSSDYSRSGWCPGTATQPTYFSLNHLAPGEHTITIAIPQGEPQSGSFSHWAVSGVIVVEY